MKRLAIITARSGSKGLPDKNMLMVSGKPLLAYSIETALESQLFDCIVLTTDSEEYIDLLSHYPICFHRRPDHLATDRSSSFDAIENVLAQSAYSGFDYFVLFQPTCPLRKVEHLHELCQRFEANMDRYDFMASVTQAHKPTVLTRAIDEDGSMKYFDIDYSSYARQNYLPEYSPNGVYYVAKPQEYLEHKHFYGARSLAYFMHKNDSLDIDDREDFEQFYMIMQRRSKHTNLKQLVKRELQHKAYNLMKSAPWTLVGDAHLAQIPLELLPRLGDLQDLTNTAITTSQYIEMVLPYISVVADRVLVSLGVNDLRQGLLASDIADRVGLILARLRTLNPKASITLLEVPQTLFRVDCRNADVSELNHRLEQEAINCGVQYLPINTRLVNKYGKLDQAYTDDGLHLNVAGYLQILTELGVK